MIFQIISFQVSGKWFSQENVTVFKLDVGEEHEDETWVDLGMLGFSYQVIFGDFQWTEGSLWVKSRDEGHVWAKSTGKWHGKVMWGLSLQEMRWQGHVRGHVGVSGTYWIFNYYFNKWVWHLGPPFATSTFSTAGLTTMTILKIRDWHRS